METPSVFSEMWDSYKSAILHSIITSFGLDFVVHDQNGGDVDTINNIRRNGQFKSERNAAAYEGRGEYDPYAYHGGNEYYRQVKHEAKSQFGIADAYVLNNTVYYGKASYLRDNPSKQASLDHIISAKEIFNDPARVMAGLDCKQSSKLHIFSPQSAQFK